MAIHTLQLSKISITSGEPSCFFNGIKKAVIIPANVACTPLFKIDSHKRDPKIKYRDLRFTPKEFRHNSPIMDKTAKHKAKTDNFAV